MKTIALYITIAFLSFNSSSAQDFQFAKVEKAHIEAVSDSLYQDEVYTYLVQNYKPISAKTNVQFLEYEPESICAFQQQFAYGISFNLDECAEEGFARMTVTFPKINIEKLKTWIEDINKDSLSETNNYKWYDKTLEYGPKDHGAGCYYTINEKEKAWVVSRRCGC
jgi:hypothetical protein